MKRFIAATFLLLYVTSAHAVLPTGSSETESGGTATPTGPIRVVTFGDSITNGFNGTPYAVFLQQLAEQNNCNLQVINAGLNGENTNDGVNRINNVLGNQSPDYILIMEGANDVIIGISPSTTTANLGAMADRARSAGAVPVISSVTPNTRGGGTEVKTIPDVLNPAIASMAAGRSVAYVDNYSALAGPNWGNYNLDGLHLNDEGQRIVANQFYGALPCGGGGGVSGDGESGGGGGCFIATAAYGSLLEPHVVLLRQFRDAYLLKYSLGRTMVDTYYAYSPPLADYISQRDSLRVAVRLLLLPLIGFAYLLVHGYGYTLVLWMYALLAIAAASKRRKGVVAYR